MTYSSIPLSSENDSPDTRYAIVAGGSRHFQSRTAVRAVLLQLRAAHPALHVIHGDQRSEGYHHEPDYGADFLIAIECAHLRISHKEYKADWKASPRGGGVLRNEQMYVDNPDVREYVGFVPAHLYHHPDKWRGTTDCKNRATQRGLPFSIHDDNGDVRDASYGATIGRR